MFFHRLSPLPPQPRRIEEVPSNYQLLLRRVLLGDRSPIVFNHRKTLYADVIHYAPHLSADPNSSNLLDWGKKDVLCVLLGDDLHLLHVTHGHHDVLSVDAVSSLRWAPDGDRLALGFDDGRVSVLDVSSGNNTLLSSFLAGAKILSLCWKSRNLLTIGGADGTIENIDVRASDSRAVGAYRGGHRRAVCGLGWSESGRQLASGGGDGVVNIWDVSMNRWLHRFAGNRGGVRALAWCPSKTHLLATGDEAIKFWNTDTGSLLSTLEASSSSRSRVSGLLWDKRELNILSSRGNTLMLREYPKMTEIAEMVGHNGKILHMAQSPDGCTLATASGEASDETLRLWKVFSPLPPKSPPRYLFSGNPHAYIR